MFQGSVGLPGFRDFYRESILNAVRCHFTNVSGFPITNPSRPSKNFATATIATRNDAAVRRGFAFRSWKNAS